MLSQVKFADTLKECLRGIELRNLNKIDSVNIDADADSAFDEDARLARGWLSVAM